MPLWVQVCARAERTGTGSKYRLELGEDGLQNGKLLRATEGEGGRERERERERERVREILRYHGKQDD